MKAQSLESKVMKGIVWLQRYIVAAFLFYRSEGNDASGDYFLFYRIKRDL